MSPGRAILFFPRAVGDLEGIEAKYRRQIMSDIALLRADPWQPAKIKRLRGVGLWEVKSGDFRSLFIAEPNRIVVVRVVNRRGLDRAVGKIDPAYVFRWLGSREET